MTSSSQPEPIISYPVAEILSRIEGKIDTIGQQMQTKADQAAVHELDSRVRVLETATATQTAVASAASRARTALWAAVASGITSAGSVTYIVVALARTH